MAYWRKMIAFAGDIVVFLTFAAIGRASHHETASNPVTPALGTAAPFIAGWLVGAWIGGAYGSTAFEGRRRYLIIGRSWVLGCAIGLGIRSLSERRVVPFSFMVVTFSFNLALLLIWRFVLNLVCPGSPVES